MQFFSAEDPCAKVSDTSSRSQSSLFFQGLRGGYAELAHIMQNEHDSARQQVQSLWAKKAEVR